MHLHDAVKHNKTTAEKVRAIHIDAAAVIIVF